MCVVAEWSCFTVCHPSNIPSMAAGPSSLVLTNELLPFFTEEELHGLRDRINRLAHVLDSLGVDPEMVLNTKSSVVDGIAFLEMVLKEQVMRVSSFESYCLPQNEPTVQISTELAGMRYLCVSNGHEIFLLDLKKTNEKALSNAGDAPPLPIIASMNVIKKKHLAAVSLFKLGSDAYIIGGQKYNARVTLHGGFDSQGSKGTSCESYLLSFAGSKATPSLTQGVIGKMKRRRCSTPSLTQGVIGKMKHPKLSPIVEEIDGTIHVFDSTLRGTWSSSDWRFSHEVLHKPGSSWEWREISTHESPVNDFIKNHLVVGPRIYAICGYNALLFNLKEEKWEALESNPDCSRNIPSETVYDILRHAKDARCVLVLGSDEVEVENRMYVIVALTKTDEQCFLIDYHDETTYATAYLVNSSGNILCMQPLNYLAGWGPMQPIGMKAGRIIRAGVEGNIICSLVNASAKATCKNCLFINTFTVEMLTSFDPSKYEGVEIPVIAPFIRVVIKESYIYKTGEHLCNSLQACFM